MKKNTFKALLTFGICISSILVTAQQTAPDEDTGPITECKPGASNTTRTSSEMRNAVNVGTIDDRSCYSDYSESLVNNVKWGVYNITDGSNHLGTSLQPRIERSLPRSKEVGVGSYARFTGTVRILEVGDATGTGNDGTYMMQSKGKHTGGGGSPDPAICLYLVKPVLGRNAQGRQVQVSFKIYREQINFRGGSGAQGRDIVFLTDIAKNVPTDIKLEVGFRQDPNDPTKRIHYSDAVIGGVPFNWNIPEPEKGTESGIRYGAYRVKGGRAQIRWANTTYKKEDVVFDPSAVGVTFFGLQNVATGQFLTAGASSKPVSMSGTFEVANKNKNWNFVSTGEFSNIDGQDSGILRGPGANFSDGPYRVVSTSKAPPATDSDKVWKIIYNTTDDTYRFQSGNSNRFLYQEENGNITHIPADDTDNRSKWKKVTEDSNSLSVANLKVNAPSIKIYPNPAKDRFTISFKNINTSVAKTIEFYNVLGKLVHQVQTANSIVAFNNTNFNSGLYLVKAYTNKNEVFHSKLIIE